MITDLPRKRICDSRVAKISRSFTHKMAAKTSRYRYGTKLRHCHPMHTAQGSIAALGNESVPKIIINDTKIFYCDQHVLVISNHSSFRVLFYKIVSVYIFLKNLLVF